MAFFGTDPALLTIDEAELARLRASRPLQDPRQAGDLERQLGNKHHQLQGAEAGLAETSRTVVELLGRLNLIEAAQKKLEKTGGTTPEITQKIEKLKMALQDARRTEAGRTRLVKSLREGIEHFLGEGPKGGPTNGELISSSREREKALDAAGL